VRLRDRRFQLLSACVVSVALAACGDDDGQPAARAGESAGRYPVKIQNCGRTLTFDRAPRRAVLPYHPVAELFVGLGLADRAVGRYGYQGAFPAAPLLPEQATDFKRIPVVSKSYFPPPKEELLALRSDFLLAYNEYEFGGKNAGADGLATAEQLGAAGVPFYTVVCPGGKSNEYGQETLAVTYRTILDIGRIFGVSERAVQRVAQMKQQIRDVATKVADEPVPDVIVYTGGKGPVDLAGEGIISEIIDLAGGRNVFSEEDNYFQASLEKVADKKADAFVIFPDLEEPTKKLDATKEARFLLKTFPNTQASKDRRVAVTTYEFTSPGWRNAQTVEDLARQLHPDAFDESSGTHQYTDG